MVYSFNLITLPNECDSLIRISERDKRNILARKELLSVRAENSAETVQDNSVELVTLNAELTAAITSIAGLPDGPKKEKQITKRVNLEARIRNLTFGDLTPVNQVEREYDIAQMDAQVATIDAFITAVTAHRATL